LSTEPEKPFRSWIGWIIAGVWILTALAVLIATRLHPATDADISLSVKEFSFLTTASNILGPSNEEELLISGVGSLRIQFNTPQMVSTGGHPAQAMALSVEGEPSASCSFYLVRSGVLDLGGASTITLGAASAEGRKSFSMKVHGPLSGNLTSRPAEGDLKPGFECRRVRVNGAQAGDLESSFSVQGGDSIFFATSDARLDFTLPAQSEIGDTQIPILEELQFFSLDPRTSDPKTVLLKGKNEVSFGKLAKTVAVKDADLLVVTPKGKFSLRQFTVQDGIQLSLGGTVHDVRAGAGAGNMKTLMPSAFDHLDNEKRIYGVVPALVALILGILEKMGALGKK